MAPTSELELVVKRLQPKTRDTTKPGCPVTALGVRRVRGVGDKAYGPTLVVVEVGERHRCYASAPTENDNKPNTGPDNVRRGSAVR